MQLQNGEWKENCKPDYKRETISSFVFQQTNNLTFSFVIISLQLISPLNYCGNLPITVSTIWRYATARIENLCFLSILKKTEFEMKQLLRGRLRWHFLFRRETFSIDQMTAVCCYNNNNNNNNSMFPDINFTSYSMSEFL